MKIGICGVSQLLSPVLSYPDIFKFRSLCKEVEKEKKAKRNRDQALLNMVGLIGEMPVAEKIQE